MKKTKQMTAILLSLSMIVSGVALTNPTGASAVNKVSPSTKGLNQSADLTISSTRELNEFAQRVNNGNDYAGKVIKLTQDIEYDGVTVNNFTPIGQDVAFRGTFDGCGYTISGIIVTGGGGLFGGIESGGIVKNVTVKDSDFSRGAIASGNRGVIENCHNKNVNIGTGGGIVGYNGGELINCSSTGDVASGTGQLTDIGGIAGENDGSIVNCCNIGNISSNASYVGGIAGRCGENSVIQNCYNVGIITGEPYGDNLGGIAGQVYFSSSVIANSYCSEESAPVNIGVMNGIERNNKALPAKEMQTESFVAQLNANRGSNTDWLEWEIRPEESEYPLPVQMVNLSQCQIVLESDSFLYDGTEKRPEVVITYDGKTLENDVDYKLTYRDNVNTGTGTITIEGLGRYMDSVELPFTIEQANISQCTISLNTDVFTYTGTAQTPSVIVKNGNITLISETDYTVTYEDNIKAGTAKVTVAGKGDYTGILTKNFTIKKADQKFNYAKSYKKVYGDNAFAPIVRNTGDGSLSYVSSDKKVVTVDNKGKVTIIGTGIATISVSAEETTNYKASSIKVTIKVSPKKQTVKVKAKQGRKLAVSWKKDKQSTGYEIQYGTSKKLEKKAKTITVKKNNTIKKTISKLTKGKKYYVRVRSYKKSGGEILYGAWSATVNKTVEK